MRRGEKHTQDMYVERTSSETFLTDGAGGRAGIVVGTAVRRVLRHSCGEGEEV